MFCQKCGTKNDETAVFCSKCGNSFKNEAVASVTQTLSPVIGTKKTKSKKKWFFILAAVVVIVIIVGIIASDDSDTYLEAVSTHQPFTAMSYTYGNVLTKYLASPSWKVRKSGNIGYVDISGTAKGTNRNMIVTVSVTPDPIPERPNRVRISTESLTIDGRRSPSSRDAQEFLMRMFTAYDRGSDDISSLF